MTTDDLDGDGFFARHLRTIPVIAIFRGHSVEQTLELCHTAWDAGVELVEVPVQTADAMPSLVAAVAAGRDRGRVVGAGTITTARQLDEVAAAGAGFAVSPGLHPPVVAAASRAGLPYLPGVATATEIAHALDQGLSWLKAFPAQQLTPGWVKAQLAPFPSARFIATGGIDAGNAAEFLAAGCRGLGISSAFQNAEGVRTLLAALRR
jgi:2-dehydro-3-deoxyphosphogluconate aldolase/(4S)-4-hydroxy-2-oxoglutarate aldolase